MPQQAQRPCANAPSCPALVRGDGVRYCVECRRARWRAQDRARPSAAKRGYGRNWRRIQARVLATRPTCQIELVAEFGPQQTCSRRAVEVHHLRRLRDGGTHAESNLVALCRYHHRRVTAVQDSCWGGS